MLARLINSGWAMRLLDIMDMFILSDDSVMPNGIEAGGKQLWNGV